MCNRYRLKAKPDQLIDMFDLIREVADLALAAEYFPGKAVPVVRQVGPARRLERMVWGFPPFKGTRPINNTRAEDAASSRFWAKHLNHRCVFPLSEAIEWQHRVNRKTGELKKVPHVLRFRDGRIAAVAGIYQVGQDAACCSMLTCRANRLWATIHNAKPDDPRMVCFLLDRDAWGAWLDPTQPFEAARGLLKPVPDELDLLMAEPLGSPPAKTVDEDHLFG
ncbi:MAG: SOS response-associated peptidase family protein [Phycisphaeraceae bacterium]|nr:SOS response-associated peptidase family protein [Phycisphaeraceae bacterium]